MEEIFEFPTTADNNTLLVDMVNNKVVDIIQIIQTEELYGLQEKGRSNIIIRSSVMNGEKINNNIIIRLGIDIAYQYNEALEPSRTVIGWKI